MKFAPYRIMTSANLFTALKANTYRSREMKFLIVFAPFHPSTRNTRRSTCKSQTWRPAFTRSGKLPHSTTATTEMLAPNCSSRFHLWPCFGKFNFFIPHFWVNFLMIKFWKLRFDSITQPPTGAWKTKSSSSQENLMSSKLLKHKIPKSNF